MYSSARAESSSSLWMAATRSISATASCTSDLPPMPSEASERSGFTNSGIRRLPPVSNAAWREKTAKRGIEDVLEGQELLGEPLVLAEVELARAAAGVAHAQQLEQAGDRDVAEDVVAEHLHQVEDEVGLAAREPGDEPLDVAVDAEDGDPVPQAAEGAGDLGHDRRRSPWSSRFRCRDTSGR